MTQPTRILIAAVVVLLGSMSACSDDASAPAAGGDAEVQSDDAGPDAVSNDAGDMGSAPLCVSDELAPWAGGSTYYTRWTRGPSSDPTDFPIAVWLQAPNRAPEYQALGINLFVGLWQGPTEAQLAALAEAGMPAIAAQNAVARAELDDASMVGWSHLDEPDNAQPDGNGGYGPCLLPERLQDRAAEMRLIDPTRPIYLNLGQGVVNESWVGRGTCSGHDEHYLAYIAATDIVSFDVYPVTSTAESITGNLAAVADGVGRLRRWANYTKPVWVWIETTHVNNPRIAPTPAQVRSEVWLAVIAGAMGVGYFAHEFEPTFVEAALLTNPEMADAVTEINRQLIELAPALNSPSRVGAVSVTSDLPIATMVKRTPGQTFLLAGSMNGSTGTATFALTCVDGEGQLEVVGEDREVQLVGGSFEDTFAPYGVHIYRTH